MVVTYEVALESPVIVFVETIVETVVCSTAVATMEDAVYRLVEEPCVIVKVTVTGTVSVVVPVLVDSNVTCCRWMFDGSARAVESVKAHHVGVTVTVTVAEAAHVDSEDCALMRDLTWSAAACLPILCKSFTRSSSESDEVPVAAELDGAAAVDDVVAVDDVIAGVVAMLVSLGSLDCEVETALLVMDAASAALLLTLSLLATLLLDLEIVKKIVEVRVDVVVSFSPSELVVTMVVNKFSVDSEVPAEVDKADAVSVVVVSADETVEESSAFVALEDVVKVDSEVASEEASTLDCADVVVSDEEVAATGEVVLASKAV